MSWVDGIAVPQQSPRLGHSMSETTRYSLITRIRDPDDSESWGEFVKLYGPFIYAIARERGLQDADACDLVQDVMQAISRSITGFEPDPSMGRFRGWVGTITRRKLARFFERSGKQLGGAGGTKNVLALSNAPIKKANDAWEQEHQCYLFHLAAERVRNEFAHTTWRAFWLTAVEGVPAKQAADDCGITVGAVYIAKSRVVNRLRERVAQMMESDSS